MDLKAIAGVHHSYWGAVWRRYKKRILGMVALTVVSLFCIVGIYAPFFASSKPFIVEFNGEWYFPLFRYLTYSGFYTKRLDIFFNVLMFTFPFFVLCFWFPKSFRKWGFLLLTLLQSLLFFYFAFGSPKDPAYNSELIQKRESHIQNIYNQKMQFIPSWGFELEHMSSYARLNLLVRYRVRKEQNAILWQHYQNALKENPRLKPLSSFPTLWELDRENEVQQIARLQKYLENPQDQANHKMAWAQLKYIQDRNLWLETESQKLHYLVMPMRPYHWEDDAGGNQALNQYLPWWELTRINRKDLVAALIFGIRISMVVGLISVFLALSIGIPIGAFAGFYGGSFDILVSRLMEIWESMPTFFMLLLVIAMTQSKSIFLVIAVIGIFGWTSFSRFMRGEFFKQRNLPYVEAGHAMGFPNRYLMFSQILPNAIPPILTLLPFAMMGAISAEAGLSFLGLGEEGSCSWGVLMDEGRSAFPAESYLLWPPAILLTILLVAIALMGDALRDALDPKLG